MSVAPPMRKRVAAYGSGMMMTWPQVARVSRVLHRVSGAAVAGFLLVHIGDIALIRLGPDVFNKLLFFYRARPFRVLEVCLLAGVLFHGLNGSRMIVTGFWPAAAKYQQRMFYVQMTLFTLMFCPAAYLMLR